MVGIDIATTSFSQWSGNHTVRERLVLVHPRENCIFSSRVIQSARLQLCIRYNAQIDSILARDPGLPLLQATSASRYGFSCAHDNFPIDLYNRALPGATTTNCCPPHRVIQLPLSCKIITHVSRVADRASVDESICGIAKSQG